MNNKTKYRIKQIGTWKYIEYLKDINVFGITIFSKWSKVPDYINASSNVNSDNYVSDKNWSGKQRPKLTEFKTLYPNIEDWFTVYSIMVMKFNEKVIK